jgi:hypothetical protein
VEPIFTVTDAEHSADQYEQPGGTTLRHDQSGRLAPRCLVVGVEDIDYRPARMLRVDTDDNLVRSDCRNGPSFEVTYLPPMRRQRPGQPGSPLCWYRRYSSPVRAMG